MNGNCLVTLNPKTFSRLEQLIELNLEYNQLSSLSDGTFEGLEKLQYLNLAYNPIAAFSDGILNGLRSLKQLRLNRGRYSEPDDNKSRNIKCHHSKKKFNFMNWTIESE
jgi:hypothetical protein